MYSMFNPIDEKVLVVGDEIVKEVNRAMKLHKGLNSLHEAKAVIEEEFDEFWEEVKVNPKKLSEDERQIRRSRICQELIQIAAMCVRTLVDLEGKDV